MDLHLTRRILTPKSTTGQLTVDGVNECYVLEDKYRAPPEPKVFGETCIPCGRYEVTKTFSPHFGHDMYLVNNVPGFEGIRIHGGNVPADTEGCLLVGRILGHDRVDESLIALAALTAKLDSALARAEKIFITIEVKQ